MGVLKWSGREDLNLRPPAPKAGALAKLRYAPLNLFRKLRDVYYMLHLFKYK